MLHHSAFDSLSGCQAAHLSEYTLYLDNFCFDVSDPNYGDYSYKFAFPDAYEYSKAGCKGHAQIVTLPATCTDSTDSRRLQSSDASDFDSTRDNDSASASNSASSSPVRRLSALAEGHRALSDDDGTTTSLYEIWSLVHSRLPADSTTRAPTQHLTAAPSVVLSASPTMKDQPTVVPTVQITAVPSVASTDRPSEAPTRTMEPSLQLTAVPSTAQTHAPPVDQIVLIYVEQVRNFSS